MLHLLKTKRQSIAIFICCLISLFLFSGCIQRNNAVNNHVVTKNNQKESFDNSNQEKFQINWKKYTNPMYSFGFEYSDYLEMIQNKEIINPFMPRGYWGVRMETSDFKEKFTKEGSPMLIVSGFKLIVFSDPIINITNFDELKRVKRLGFGGTPFVKEEVKKINSREFFIQTHQKQGNNIGWRINTLYKPNLVIEIIILGVDEYEKDMQKTIDHILGSFY